MSAEQTPDIADLRRGIAAYVCNVSNLPEPLQAPALGVGMGDLIDGLTAALAPVLDAAVREAGQRAWDDETVEDITEFVRTFETGDQAATALSLLFRAIRADRITEPVSHEAATSGEEASKA